MSSVVLDVRSAHLTKAVRAATLVVDLPTSTKRRLNDSARAVRLFIEAHSLSAASEALALLQQYVDEAMDKDEITAAVTGKVEALRKVLP